MWLQKYEQLKKLMQTFDTKLTNRQTEAQMNKRTNKPYLYY